MIFNSTQGRTVPNGPSAMALDRRRLVRIEELANEVEHGLQMVGTPKNRGTAAGAKHALNLGEFRRGFCGMGDCLKCSLRGRVIWGLLTQQDAYFEPTRSAGWVL